MIKLRREFRNNTIPAQRLRDTLIVRYNCKEFVSYLNFLDMQAVVMTILVAIRLPAFLKILNTIPNSIYNQIQKENCAKVPKDSYEQRERKECLPFEMTQAQLEELHHYDPCAQYQVRQCGLN